MALQINLDKACTICLQESEQIGTYTTVDNEIQEKILKCFPSFYDEDKYEYPEKICITCLEDLNASLRFYKNCEQTLNLLLQTTEIHFTNYIEQVNGEGIEENEQDDKSDISNEEGNQLQYEEYSEQEQHEYEEEQPVDIEYEKHDDDDNEYNGDLDNLVQNSNEDHSSMITVAKTETRELKRFKSRIDRDTNRYLSKTTKTSKSLPKICELCGNTYKYQHALKAHMRRHLNDRPFKCEFCEKKFVSNVELRRHMRVHTGHKPYRCSYCERCFSDFGSRIKHERTHTGERPFVCETCNKSFAYAHVLTVHLRTHTGEKKFKCNECGRGFTKKAYLAAHMQQHSQSAEIDAKDKEIHKTLSNQQKSLLEDAKETVNKYDGGILKCAKCGAGFSKKSSMLLHMEQCNIESAVLSDLKVVENFDETFGECITAYIIQEDYEDNCEQVEKMEQDERLLGN